ncbi:mucin-5AC [Manduca sexta]|uniref:VWFC domain-containing protein n=1 Tax=Manduca sexta TaxID=7130 RepID=A0A922CRY2_MANSE|nr:mucin-5AC [Manduca sexta]KAG6457265.1 hypothetical protein O3G_MSEX010194 [Manduca sexta]
MAGYRGGAASAAFWMSLATSLFVATCRAGPVGPLPNVTSVDMGLKEGSCALGDVVYLPGDDFPGTDPCEKCKCSNGGVQCEKQQCEPRPGCKALHRPDHCCPTYQCECEQEGRVYSNGEKLVDPADPCRVCYCQGGEVVCRTIACFVRDDCSPRLVPGRCCPEYDNCPVRGVTVLPGISSLPPHLSTTDEVKNSPVQSPKENIKQEITIKEITPVSEIPVITDVKIKEILPSPSIDVAEYSSSKSPLIPREATSEKSVKSESEVKIETPTITEVHASPAFEESKADTSNKDLADMPPSKISFSTQDSINSEIYPSNGPIIATMGVPSMGPDPMPVATTTKSPVMEEEDTSLFDHNPAFPPLPDDFSVLSNHGEDIVPEPSADSDHIPPHEMMIPNVVPTEPKVEEPLSTTQKDLPDTTVTTVKIPETSAEVSTLKVDSTEFTSPKDNPMLNLRSAIPIELLGVPAYIAHDLESELDTTTDEPASISTILGSENSRKVDDNATEKPTQASEEQSPTMSSAEIDTTTHKLITTTDYGSSIADQEQTNSSIAKSNIATEVTSQTELSSLPIETSDQKPHETEAVKDKSASTTDPLMTSSRISPTGSEVITVSRAVSGDNNMFENVETTEFILTPLGSMETATDSVELIKISGDSEKHAPIIEASAEENKTNLLKDLINLVSDVASINDHTDSPGVVHVTGVTSIADSEELIPVNAGYKSKNSNSNQNSITEVPVKNKNAVNKQKVVEIEGDGDDTDNITDSPPPNDKIEPTTRRPIIDNVSDDMPENKTEKKDIEIITQSYVPTINRRPTKVVMKKSNDKPISDSLEDTPISFSAEMTTEGNASSSEAETVAPDVTTLEVERMDNPANATLSTK